ncbi:MAG: ATP-binding protein [Acidimicrobiaceae bacterium]|nr:ATP-binding protein [Acidimicrobiaceae bacterium]
MTAMLGALAALLMLAVAVLVTERIRLRRWLRRSTAATQRGTERRSAVRQTVTEARRRAETAETARRDAEVARQRIASSLDALWTGLVLCDASGQIVARNTAADSVLRARHGEALVAGMIEELLERARNGEEVTSSVELHAEPRKSYEVRACPLLNDGEMLGAVALVRDTTESQRVESVRKDFVANVSHELKTPIGALSLLADTLSSDPDPQVARQLVERMQFEIQRVADTIEDLLTLSLLEDDSGHVAAPLDIGKVIAAAVDRITESAEQRRVQVVASIPGGLAPVSGSRRHLESAVFNLLDNAVKFSEPGGRVDVTASAGAQHSTVSVSDQGIGIPAAEQSRIFERFYRVDRARGRNTGGTGLGLSIVRHVALNHGGEVSVTSREGFGAEFRLTLPRDSPAAATNADAPASPAAPPQHAGLAADDGQPRR